VESQITARHQIDYKIPIAAREPLLCCKGDRGRTGAYMYSMSWKLYLKLQMKGWLTYSSIRRSRMMLRTLSDRTTVGIASRLAQLEDNRHYTTRKGHADDCRYRHEWYGSGALFKASSRAQQVGTETYLHLCGCI
jgi:hypothetical protein